jgi:hypothetical protein
MWQHVDSGPSHALEVNHEDAHYSFTCSDRILESI